jgi:Tol biopolymer transport system component
MIMKKNSTSFSNKLKSSLQITNPLPAIAALLTIIGLLAGTTTTAIIPAVWATTGTVSIENRTDTEVTTQSDEGLADEETQQSTAIVGGEPSSTNQSASTTEEEDENTSVPSTEPPEVEPSVTLNQSETEGQEPPSSSSSANQSDSTTLTSSNSTNATATATANATNAINTTDARLDGRIVFAKAPTGDDPFSTDIYVMNADGSGGQTRLTRVTDTGAYASSPSWSPDGEKIAFESDTDGNREIYVMNADGSSVTRLTNNNASDESPSWSPDGERIAFVSDRAFQDPEGLNRNHEIYVMNANDGSGQTRLTNNNALDYNPSWSPNSERIAFRSDTDDNSGIYVMNADDGSGETRLTEESEDAFGPSWSPDGEKIAFNSNRGNSRGIYVMNADDGSNVTRLTDGGSSPTWSPNGQNIAFISSRDAGDESDDNAIYIMISTGDDGSSNVTRLTEPDSYYTDLDWGRNTSSPVGGNGGGGSTPTSPRPQQIIDDAISTIENLDNIPQSLRTNIIALLRQVLDNLNDVNSTTSANTTTTTELASSSSSLMTQGSQRMSQH